MMETNKIYHWDCLDVMKQMPDNFVDLTVTSPPYDNQRDYKWYVFDFEKTAQELYRVTKDWWVVVRVVWDQTIDGSESWTSFKQALYFKELWFNLYDTMIYAKKWLTFPDAYRYYNIFEYMFVFSKWKPKSINLLKDRKNKYVWERNKSKYRQKDWSLIGENKIINIKEYGYRFNIRYYGIWYMKSTTDKTAFEHPAIFPEELARDHILTRSNKWDLVFDPFMWSWTTAKMAITMWRNYIWAEISEEYIDIINKRLNNIQKSLF